MPTYASPSRMVRLQSQLLGVQTSQSVLLMPHSAQSLSLGCLLNRDLRLEGERNFVPLERMQANILLRPTTTCSGHSRVASAPMLLSRSHPHSPFATECIPHTKSKLATHPSILSVNLTPTSFISSNIRRPSGNWPSGFRLVGYLSKHQTTSHRAVASTEPFPRWQGQYLRRWYVLPSRMQTSRLRKIFNLPF